MTKKLNYVTAPEIKEASDLLIRVRDFYTYSLFDILKLGIPTSEQLSKSLSKATQIGHFASDVISEFLKEKDREANLKNIDSKSIPSSFSKILMQYFGNQGEDSPNGNFIHEASRMGRFVFTDEGRFEYFLTELDRLHKDFVVKKLNPYLQRHSLMIDR